MCVARGVETPGKRTRRRIDNRRRNPIVTAVVALVVLLRAMPEVGIAVTATLAAKVAAAAAAAAAAAIIVVGRCPNHRCFDSEATAAWAAAWSRFPEAVQLQQISAAVEIRPRQQRRRLGATAKRF